MTTNLIGARIKALREERKLSQDELARIFGFKDRQTVSAIETGERRVSAEELLVAVEKLGASLDYFTDPFMLVGEGQFSWRQTNAGGIALDAYERVAGRWIAAYRELNSKLGEPKSLLRRRLGLTRHHQFEDAMVAGEQFAAEFQLGSIPAARLAEAMENELQILVLNVEAFNRISGAACRLPELDAVLINRNEVAGRRHFDLGARALPHPHMGCDATSACGGSERNQHNPGRAARKQFRLGRTHAKRGSRPFRRLVVGLRFRRYMHD